MNISRKDKKQSLAITHPELVKQWHPTLNGDLTPDQVSYGSDKNIYWQCEKGHEWRTKINNRTHGKDCPYCSGRYPIKGENDLATTHPHLIKEWHPTLNKGLTPQQASSGSDKKIWWKCEKGHEWDTAVHNRVKGSGCPYCSGQKAWVGFNDLATTYPELAKEWHPTLNKGLTPQQITAGSGKKIWWQCEKGHEWDAAVHSRVHGNGCPICSGRKILIGFNDLATTHPELAEEWHSVLNEGLTTQEVSAGSGKKVWWQCEKGHEWQATIVNRAKVSGCPTCNSNGTSFPEQCLFFYLLKAFPNCLNRYQMGTDEIDIFIPEIGLAIEYDGFYWHESKLGKDIEKSQRIATMYKILRIREEGLPLFEIEGVECLFTTIGEKDLPITLMKVLDFILENFNLEPSTTELIKNVEINLEIDKTSILENYLHYEYKNSLAFLYPDLVEDWHPTKNGQLRPENFRSGSHKKVWWRCSKGHEWESTVKNRTRGSGCSYCCGKSVIKGENDLATTDPKIAKEWHPTLNEHLTPQDVALKSNKKVWWQCEKGHEWEATVANRTKGSGCAYCSGKKTLAGFNDLETTHPELVREWHPTLNNGLTPQQLTAGSGKKVWWKCSKGHEWDAIVNSRTNGVGCPYCSNRKVLVGFNDLATTHPELAKQWDDSKNGDLTPQYVTAGSGKSGWWQCEKGHGWKSAVRNRVNGSGCPECRKNKSSY